LGERPDCIGKADGQKMYYAYILKSNADESYYTGHCQDIHERLKRHNDGHSKSTKARRPWQLVYYEEYKTRSEAVKREQEIKKQKSRLYIEQLIATFE